MGNRDLNGLDKAPQSIPGDDGLPTPEQTGLKLPSKEKIAKMDAEGIKQEYEKLSKLSITSDDSNYIKIQEYLYDRLEILRTLEKVDNLEAEINKLQKERGTHLMEARTAEDRIFELIMQTRDKINDLEAQFETLWEERGTARLKANALEDRISKLNKERNTHIQKLLKDI